MLIPINEEYEDIAHDMQLALLNEDIRAKVNYANERLSKKIRDAQIKKIPYQVVIGKKEAANNSVTYRQYGKTNEVCISLKEFIKLLKKQIKLMK